MSLRVQHPPSRHASMLAPYAGSSTAKPMHGHHEHVTALSVAATAITFACLEGSMMLIDRICKRVNSNQMRYSERGSPTFKASEVLTTREPK